MTAATGPVVPTATASTRLRPGAGGRIDAGLWAERRAVIEQVSLPDGWRRLLDAGNIHNLQLAARAARSGPLNRPDPAEYRNDLPFMDSDLAKWLEAAGWALGSEDLSLETPGAQDGVRVRLEQLVDDAVHLLSQAQEPDGYLNSYVQVVRPRERWQHLDWGHEHYTAGHLLQAAVAHHRATGREDLLDLCRRLADCIDAAFGPEGSGKAVDGVDGHPEIEMGLVELYRVTGERRYLDLATYFVDRRGQGVLPTAVHAGRSFGSRYWQDHAPLREATTVEGHAVRQLYLLAGAVDVATENDDPGLLAAVERLWEDMVATKTYVTGGVGAHHTDESFGDPYELPNERAYAETCAAIASFMLSWRLLLATGRARYADLAERTLYNAVLPGVSLTGDTYLYVNPLQVRDDRTQARDRQDGDHGPIRTPWFRCACCPPNVMRTLASLEHYVLATGTADGTPQIHVAQYLPGEYLADPGAGPVRLAVETDLPWDGVVRVRVEDPGEPSRPWTLALRDPAWSVETTVTPEPDDAPVVRSDGWIRITRVWAPGDVVRLDLDLSVRTVVADPRVDTTRGCIAYERGPLVFCLEGVDHPDVRLDDVVVDPAAAVDAAYDAGLLGGVVALRTRGRRRLRPDDGGWWPYRPAGRSAPASQPVADQVTPGEGEGDGEGDGVDVVAVPYFAWGNRAAGAMRVWVATT